MWQNEEARCVVVLREVFWWLGGEDLARAGATCRVWRRLAADPPLWRRLVLRAAAAPATPTAPRALDVLLATTDNYEWREEFVRAHAPWRLTATVPAGVGGEGGAALLHGALAPKEPWLALAADDASVSVWSRAGGVWRERCRHELREERGWASAARVLWAADSQRLLVAGPRALADLNAAWELLVLQYDDECHGRVVSRARCGAGAAGCWMNSSGDAFLSLETSALAPGVACTAVWLNAATQETQSEYAGVTTRLLRVYNEDSANILHALVLELPWSSLDTPPCAGDAASYYRATRARAARPGTDTDDEPTHSNEGEWSRLHVLVLCWDGGRSAGGRGGAVSVWSLGAPQPPPLEARAAGSLRARYLAHRERMRAPPPDPPPPDEPAVRALCTAPEAACELTAPPLGIAPHPGGQCLWKLYRPHACGRGASTSCAGAGPAAAPPPCTPPPRPACRAHPARSVRAVRVVCCPPAAGHRPPCPPHEPPPSITCADVFAKESGAIQCSSPRLDSAHTPLSCDTDAREGCGAEQDRVARRLALAEAVRRRDYEREAARPRERVATTPRVQYRLGCERECARATDGRDYSIPCESPQHCGPARTPPPPHCVELAPDDACRVHKGAGAGARLDPCAHRPRLLVHIDRSPPKTTSTTSTAPTTQSGPPHTASTVSSIKSRIMQSLTQGVRPPGSNRLTSKCQGNSSFGRRNFHLSTRSFSNVCPSPETETPSTTKHTGGLDSVLRQRAKLREAGRGRTVCGTTIKKSSQSTGVCGQIELPVPGGARRVRVLVALEDDRGEPLAGGGLGGGGGTTRRGRCTACRSEEIIAMTETRDSWLSIKNLQKKISGYTRGDDAKTKQKGGDQKPGTPVSKPCVSPQPAPSPPLPKREPSTRPCSPPTPCAPNKTQTEEKIKPKPQCRYIPISLTAAPVP